MPVNQYILPITSDLFYIEAFAASALLMTLLIGFGRPLWPSIASVGAHLQELGFAMALYYPTTY